MEALCVNAKYNRFNKGLYEWIGFKEKVIPYKNETRKAGKSKFGFKKSLNYAIQGIISLMIVLSVFVFNSVSSV